MKYKSYEIVAEVVTGRAEYSLDKNGNLNEWLQSSDTEPEIEYYGVYNTATEEIEEWFDTKEGIFGAKKYIDEQVKLKETIK